VTTGGDDEMVIAGRDDVLVFSILKCLHYYYQVSESSIIARRLAFRFFLFLLLV
jgi:hypothetical protein